MQQDQTKHTGHADFTHWYWFAFIISKTFSITFSLNPLLKFETTLVIHPNIQQHSFNPMSGKPALEKSSPKIRRFASYQQKASSMKHTSHGHIQKGLQKCLYINHCVISWSPVSYPINFFSCGNATQHSRGSQRPWPQQISTRNTPLD